MKSSRPAFTPVIRFVHCALMLGALVGLPTVISSVRAAELPPIVSQTSKGLPRLTAGKAVIEQIGRAYIDGTGPNVLARGGDWRLSNEKIALTFAGVDDAGSTLSMAIPGFQLPVHPEDRTPGALIDIAINGEPTDFLAYLTQGTSEAADAKKIQYDTAAPVRDGDRVGLRLTGSPYENSLMRVRTTYWLAAGQDHATIQTEVFNLQPNEPIPLLTDRSKSQVGLFVDYGHGLIRLGQNAKISGRYYAGYSGFFSAGLAPTSGTLTGHYYGPQNVFSTEIKRPRTNADSEGSTVTLAERTFWLGDGAMGSLHGPILSAQGVKLTRIEGQVVRDGAQTFMQPQLVTLFHLEPTTPTEVVPKNGKAPIEILTSIRKTDFETLIRTDLNGNFKVDVPPGYYAAAPRATTSPRNGASEIFHVFPGRTNGLKIAAPPRSGVRVKLVDDATSRPLDGRVIFEPVPPSEAATFLLDGRMPAYNNEIYIGSAGRVVETPDGSFVLRGMHGPRYRMADQMVKVPEGKIVDVTLRIKEVSPTPGWVGVEMGARTTATPGCTLSPEAYVQMSASEGLDWIVSGDFEHLTDFAPIIKKLGLNERIGSSVGFRTMLPAHPEWGQVLVFPVGKNDPDPAKARAQWAGITDSKQWIATLRKLYPQSLIQVDVPMTFLGNGFFTRGEKSPYVVGWDPAPDAATNINLINIYPSRSVWGFKEANALWYNLMARGHAFVGSTAPLARGIIGGEPGYPRLMVHVGDVKPADLTEKQIVAGIRAHHTQVSTGPFVDLRIGDHLPGDVVELSNNEPVSLRVTAPNWQPVARMTIDKEGLSQIMNLLNLEDNDAQRFPDPLSGRKRGDYTFQRLRMRDDKDTLLGSTASGMKTMDQGLPRYSSIDQNIPLVFVQPYIIDANGNQKYDPLAKYGDRGK